MARPQKCGECVNWRGQWGESVPCNGRAWALCDHDFVVCVAGTMSVYSGETPACEERFEPYEEAK